MKEFVLGSAFLMFISSLPAGVSNGHTVRLEPELTLQKAAFLQSFGNSLPPIGYVTFCREHEAECRPSGQYAGRVQLTAQKRNELERVNRYVNQSVSPVTDLDLYGKVEVWTYPSGKGDCEDYVLLKRRLLIKAGWPREALLITVVRDRKDEGHAVLTVKTDHGEFILDNQAEAVLPWFETGYRFVKRQSQKDPNVWVSLSDPRPAPATVARQRR